MKQERIVTFSSLPLTLGLFSSSLTLSYVFVFSPLFKRCTRNCKRSARPCRREGVWCRWYMKAKPQLRISSQYPVRSQQASFAFPLDFRWAPLSSLFFLFFFFFLFPTENRDISLFFHIFWLSLFLSCRAIPLRAGWTSFARRKSPAKEQKTPVSTLYSSSGWKKELTFPRG